MKVTISNKEITVSIEDANTDVVAIIMNVFKEESGVKSAIDFDANKVLIEIYEKVTNDYMKQLDENQFKKPSLANLDMFKASNFFNKTFNKSMFRCSDRCNEDPHNPYNLDWTARPNTFR